MGVHITRDSVSAADDMHAPHALQLSVPDDWTCDSLVRQVWQGSNLPNISGGKATWALSSNIPLAVVAQEWEEPSLTFRLEPDPARLDISDATIRLHWSYFAQLDPALVLRVLRGLRLRAT